MDFRTRNDIKPTSSFFNKYLRFHFLFIANCKSRASKILYWCSKIGSILEVLFMEFFISIYNRMSWRRDCAYGLWRVLRVDINMVNACQMHVGILESCSWWKEDLGQVDSIVFGTCGCHSINDKNKRIWKALAVDHHKSTWRSRKVVRRQCQWVLVGI